jgi:ERCC4-type nuclease
VIHDSGLPGCGKQDVSEIMNSRMLHKDRELDSEITSILPKNVTISNVFKIVTCFLRLVDYIWGNRISY